MINNKRGSFTGIIYITGGLLILLFAAFIFVFGSSTLNFVADQIVPAFDGIGMAGDTNVTQISQIALHPINSMIQSMTWFGVIIFIFGILAVFGLAYAYRSTSQRWLIPLFFIMMFILVLTCILFSNMYQDLLVGNDDLTAVLNENTGLNYFILYSPLIMTIVGFFAGVIMFGGGGQEETA